MTLGRVGLPTELRSLTAEQLDAEAHRSRLAEASYWQIEVDDEKEEANGHEADEATCEAAVCAFSEHPALDVLVGPAAEDAVGCGAGWALWVAHCSAPFCHLALLFKQRLLVVDLFIAVVVDGRARSCGMAAVNPGTYVLG